MNNHVLPFIVFPIGYDPTVASGPPDEDYIKMGITWTPQDTEKCKLMEHQVEEIYCEADKFHPNDEDWRMKVPMVGRWSLQTTKAEFLASLTKPKLDYQI